MIQGQRSMPILSVKNVEKSSAFFSDGLGFSLAGFWKDDEGKASFAIVVMDKITVGLQRGKTRQIETWAAYFYVTDIDALAAQAASGGVKIIRDVTEQPYGCRDFEVEDLDGNVLCFGQDMSPGENGPGL
jgi:predicted enzyme related to lactoylglutathione lyase